MVSSARGCCDCNINSKGGGIRIALAGNPNVGKSTLFNALTGLKQHTGNWTGKTVECAEGRIRGSFGSYTLVDVPGTYSLYPHSKEEEVAAEYLVFGDADLVVVVLDATSPERGIGLALSVIDTGKRVIVALNLIDEARKRGIKTDTSTLQSLLGVPVIPIIAKKKQTHAPLINAIEAALCEKKEKLPEQMLVGGVDLSGLVSLLSCGGGEVGTARYLAALLLSEAEIPESGKEYIKRRATDELFEELSRIKRELGDMGIGADGVSDLLARELLLKSREIAEKTVSSAKPDGKEWLDRIITGRWSAYPVMLLFLFGILYLTVTLANYPSQLLSRLFDGIGGYMCLFFERIGAPTWLKGALIDGVYTVLTEVIAVMLPPMAIFFPLFTLLEDMGFLPRIAYNLDRPFRCVGACGKQSLTMCMGLGCNAAGIVGCRIIDSERERKLAIVTNALVPCNGRFPTVILLSGAFFAVGKGPLSGLFTALSLAAVILIGVFGTFLMTFILSRTVFRGEPSFFTLELPPYRSPSVLRVLLRSLVDRTVKILGRAVVVAAPAGLVLWLLTSVKAGNVSLLVHINAILDPFGRAIGLDGVIITAFILGFVANEIVLPIALVGYTSLGIGEALGAEGVADILVSAGWTPLMAASFILFSLFHFPCSTSVLTVYKETKSIKLTALSFFAPTLLGVGLCFLVNLIASL